MRSEELVCDHDWQLAEADLTAKGADQVKRCSRCDAVQYEPGQATARDTRPPL
jgi:hypothetical protein